MNSLFFGLIGEHLSHSFSKTIHREMGCKDYCHKEISKEKLDTFIKENKFGALNVTIPYKKDVAKLCDKLTPEAKSTRAVNSVITHASGALIGHNTDVDGFLWMTKNAKIELKNKKAIILGSGGASLAVSFALEKAGAKSITVISRTGENNYENLSLHYDAEIIVNATPVGMYPNSDGQPIDLSPFKRCEGVLDLIYNPFRTKLLIQAEELAIPCSNGLSMLVSQAFFAQKFFGANELSEEEIPRIMKKVALGTRNISLIGMPGTGKTTVGKALSKLSGKEVIDTDEEIVKKSGLSIPEIFEKGGEALFRKLEKEAVLEACQGFGKIIVTGGGAVKTEDNYIPLKQTSRIYHLERDPRSLPREGRPLSKGVDLLNMYEERRPLYTRFRDATINVEAVAEDTAKKIWSDFCENTCN